MTYQEIIPDFDNPKTWFEGIRVAMSDVYVKLNLDMSHRIVKEFIDKGFDPWKTYRVNAVEGYGAFSDTELINDKGQHHYIKSDYLIGA